MRARNEAVLVGCTLDIGMMPWTMWFPNAIVVVCVLLYTHQVSLVVSLVGGATCRYRPACVSFCFFFSSRLCCVLRI
ncbi:hypothetical protein F5Y03DRAFT_340123 [Xylaria venustula]|nr:hypothetical protein F5Y03DRAFT_340123 [Xylaria venustula]